MIIFPFYLFLAVLNFWEGVWILLKQVGIFTNAMDIISKKGITLFPACYQRRKGKNIPNRLYKGLRCGICHTLLPKEGIYVSSTEKQDLSGNPICLNIHTFYDDFRSACISLLNNDAYKDKLAEKFIAISNNSSTGSTQTIINLK